MNGMAGKATNDADVEASLELPEKIISLTVMDL